MDTKTNSISPKIDNKHREKSPYARFLITMAVLIFLLCWGLVLNVNTGSVDIPAREVFSMVGEGLRCWVMNLFTGEYVDELNAVMTASPDSRIIFSIRMPRMLLAAILGGALALSGFLLQTFFRNPIAGPFVLGISSGAKMVVGVTTILLVPYIKSISSTVMIISAFTGSLIIVSVVLLFSQRVRSMSMLLVIGIMVGYICSAVTDFCITFASEEKIISLTSWSMGSFSGANWSNVVTAGWICLLATILAWFLSKPIAAYALGEGYAQSLGINIKFFRAALIILSSLLSACVTAFAGPISFVGIAVPHITRTMLKTARPAIVIPTVYLSGAVFCIFCDLIARTAFAPAEMAIGTVTSIFGAPVVIYMMLKRQKSQN